MGLYDDSEETRRIGIWDEKHDKPKVIEVSTAQYALLEKLANCKFDPQRSHEAASITITTPTKCKLAINAMFMAYSAICPSEKSIEDLNDHLAGCLAQDSALAVLEALDVLRAGIERGEWFEES